MATPCIRLLSTFALASVLFSTATVVEAGRGPTRIKPPKAYPVVISAPGSYILTGNLVVPDANTHAVLIGASDVTLDLGGFSVSGPITCSGLPNTCSGSGTGIGIVTGGGATNTTVRNGTVRGFGFRGLSLGTSTIEDVRVVENGEDGIVASECTIRDSIARRNGTDGFQTNGCTVTGSVAVYNGQNGFLSDSGVVTASVANGNGLDGFSSFGTASNSAAFIDNAAVSNDGTGISTGWFGVNLVTGNLLFANDGLGITGTSSLGFAHNAVGANTGGTTSGGWEMSPNVCGGDLVCP